MKEKNKLKENKVVKLIITILVILGFFIVSQLPMGLIPVITGISKKMPTFGRALLGIGWVILLFVIVKWVWGYYKKHTGDSDTKITKQDIGTAFGFFIIGRIIAVIGTVLMTKIYGVDTSANDAAIQELFGPDSQLVTVLLLTLAISVGAPILEELTFRGLPTKLLFKKTPTWVPMILTSLAFSSVHLSENIVSFLMYFLLGILMYLAYNRRGRIVDSMLMHFFNNILPAIVLLIGYLTQR